MTPEDDAARAAAAVEPVDRMTTLPPPETSAEVRDRLVDLLRRDLVGPHPDLDPDLAREVIAGSTPSSWYLTGFLAPRSDAPQAPEPEPDDEGEAGLDDQRATEGLGEVAGRGGAEDEGESEPPRRSFLPSSMGLTVLVPVGCEAIEARVTWGDYQAQPPLPDALVLPEAAPALESGDRSAAPGASDLTWHRTPREERMTIPVETGEWERPVPGSGTPQRGGRADALMLAVRVREPHETPLPDGTVRHARGVSVFLVNRRFRVARKYADLAHAHQARLELTCAEGFAPRDDRSTLGSQEFDERLADLHYRDERSFAAGHNVSADWDEADGAATRVWTEPLPRETVLSVSADVEAPGVERGMEALADAAEAGPDALREALRRLPDLYAEWAVGQAAEVPALPERRREVAEECLKRIEVAHGRIEAGIRRLANDRMSREAFAVMNRAVARSNRQRVAGADGDPDAVPAPRWRLFQLAFVLLNLDGLVEPTHEDREVVDLLFFPTGGGKTEAYLGLAAFAIALRRLANPGLTGAGLSVVMRYTLRLLTLDQLARAAGLVCALELERRERGRLGDWPIEIGLWVGGAATPNRMGSSKDNGERTLVGWLRRMRNGGPTPLPLKACPWCGAALEAGCFTVHPNLSKPQRLDVTCGNARCAFSEDRLPIATVDDEIYRRLPAFLIATVDKFANVPWEGRSGAFFGHVTRHDASGFYGAAEPRDGAPLERELPPIDLVIQDELHLISGPLGTVAGLYETAFDLIASRLIDGRRRGPKIVASTATVRRAETQIRALFGRERTEIFPPPGPSRHDSFFARTDRGTPGRLYLGVASPGRGPKLVFLRTLQTLLSGARALSAGGERDPADPYLTALCYFNALRELGGARRIVDDEVRRNLSHYGQARVRARPVGAPFADRQLKNETIELTSRVSTDDVAQARSALGHEARMGGAADVALATNMISVGLDIPRLGLMVVQGQPKTAAEYIQATSRVGRSRDKPGLVVALLNLHKPRDRTHYELYRAFHASFYRSVEATSVTPFAPRALDRALAAMLVAAARHVEPDLTPKQAAEQVAGHPHVLDCVRDALRAKLALCGIEGDDAAAVLDRLAELHAAWQAIADEQTEGGGGFLYDGAAAPQRLLQEPMKRLPTDTDGRRAWFEAGRSMRETEPAALLKLRRPDGGPLKAAS